MNTITIVMALAGFFALIVTFALYKSKEYKGPEDHISDKDVLRGLSDSGSLSSEEVARRSGNSLFGDYVKETLDRLCKEGLVQKVGAPGYRNIRFGMDLQPITVDHYVPTGQGLAHRNV